ncbi:MAG: transposase [Nitrosarchaeum sp.]|nr:transposase [Nitrosarchaeum sp.]
MKNDNKIKKKYSNEFKQEAASRSYVIGIVQTCEELGISRSALARWRGEFSNKSKNNNSKPSYDELEKEVKKLKKEMAYMEEINRILKKSTAIFSSNQMINLK